MIKFNPQQYSTAASYFNQITTGSATSSATKTDSNSSATSALEGATSAANSSSQISNTTDSSSDTVGDFMTYMKESPAQRMREDIIKSLGLTDDEIKKMPPDKQKAVEKQIADIMKQKLTGQDKQMTNGVDPNPATASITTQKLSTGVNKSLLQLQQVGSSGIFGSSSDSSEGSTLGL